MQHRAQATGGGIAASPLLFLATSIPNPPFKRQRDISVTGEHLVVYTGVFGILGREMSVKELLMKKGNKTKDNKKTTEYSQTTSSSTQNHQIGSHISPHP